MIKIGSSVSWQGKVRQTGKVIASSGKRWKIESGGKNYFVPKDQVKRGYNRKAPAKKAETKKKTPAPDKDLLQKVLGVMAEVGKEKGKSTKKEVDSKVAMDKKAREGKLTQKAFLEDITLVKGYDEKNDEIFGDMSDRILDDIGDNAKTESQMEKAVTRASNRAYTEIGKYRRRLFNRVIKGKKFKSLKEAENAFLEDFNYNAYFSEDD
jgi:hypothetical protein